MKPYVPKLTELLRRIDVTLITVVTLLSLYGLLMIYSATQGASTTSNFYYFKKQLIWILIGFVGMAIMATIDYNKLKHYLVPIYLLNVLLLALVLIIGQAGQGAQRWIEIAGFSFQPSEVAKFLLVITLGAVLSVRKGNLSGWDVGLVVIHTMLPLLLVVAQPDLGTSLCLVAILLGILFIAGITSRQLAIFILISIILFAGVIHFGLLKEYQIKRLVVFLDPDVDPLGAGYNLLQSKIAIGSGQLFGKGIFSGTQTNLKFLPARHTDFIFSVIGEELGFAGTSLLLFLFYLLISRAIRIALLSRNLFGTLIACGVISLWLFEILINVGMTIGLAPITGIPLPFISYGGSAILTNMVATGLLLSVYRKRFV
jgi:rod shape determining protein RodA